MEEARAQIPLLVLLELAYPFLLFWHCLSSPARIEWQSPSIGGDEEALRLPTFLTARTYARHFSCRRYLTRADRK